MNHSKKINTVCTVLVPLPPHTTMLLPCSIEYLECQISIKFSSECLPLLDVATNATIVDWAKILFDNLVTAIVSYRSKRAASQRIYPPFYLYAYIMDSICYVSKFPIMGWKWTTQDPLPIHVYHKELWDSQFTPYFYQICHGIMLPLYRMLYDKDPPRCSPEEKVEFSPLQDGSERNCSLMSGYLGVPHPLMSYPCISLIKS